MLLELERKILGWILQNPSLLEKFQVAELNFESEKHRRIFMEVQRQFNENLKIDPFLISEKIGGDGIASYLASLTDGLHRLPIENFMIYLIELKKGKLIKEFLKETEKQRKAFLKAIPIDLTESRELMSKITALGISTQNPEFENIEQTKSQAVKFLWKSRIPLGMITLVCGDPGIGKSFLTTWLAAKLSRGESLPDCEITEKSSTVILAAEDSPSFAIKPRAEANNADCSKIHVFKGSAFNIQDDIQKLKFAVEKDESIRLIVIDPLNSYIGKTDYLKDPDVRLALLPLVQFAENKNIAILAVVHLNKREDLSSIYRIGGSIAFTGIARSILAIAKDEEDNERRLLMPLKINYAKKPMALAFRIQDDLRLVFEEKPIEANVDEAFSPHKRVEASERNFVDEWLKEMLAAGPIDSDVIIEKASKAGFPRTTLFNAKKRLGISSIMHGFGAKRISEWRLPEKA
jgi:archaellum biogenesis ATPase FlaH